MFKPELTLKWLVGDPGSPGKSQKDGQEDQGTLKQLGELPLALALLPLHGPPGPPSGSLLGCLELRQAILPWR